MKLVGSWFLPDEEEHLAKWLENDPAGYQVPHRENALKHVKEWRVAVDVGAHVGLWSRDFALKFGEVHAFEPVLEHRLCFARNVPAGNVTLHPFALGETEGAVKMNLSPHSTGGTHVAPGAKGEIPMRTLDSFQLPIVDFIKLDCEAYELYVLKGATETIKRCKPVICIEQKNQGYYGNPRYAARDYLVSLGMKELSRVRDDIVLGW